MPAGSLMNGGTTAIMKKTIIVTGAAGNLGKAVVQKFLEKDYHVVAVQRRKEASDSALQDHLETLELDLLNEAACEQAIARLIEAHQQIDVAVLTAGGFAMGNIESTGTEALQQQYQLNFETAYHIVRPVFRRMMERQEGCIFLIGSRAGQDVSQAKGVLAYALSKSLLFRLAEALNAEAKHTNVVVSVVVPSIIDTPQNRAAMPDADFSKWVPAAHIADVIHFYTESPAGLIREPVIKVYNRS